MGRALRVVWSAALLAGPVFGCMQGEEAAVWSAYQATRAATEAGDLEALRDLVTAEQAASFEGEEAAAMLELARAMLPKDPERVAIEIEGDTATLTLRGTQTLDGGDESQSIPGKATVSLLREGGRWKVAKEDWTFEMSFGAELEAGGSFVAEGQRLHPQQVLTGHADAPSLLAQTRDGSLLISASYGDYTVRVWDVETGRLLSMATLDGRPTSLSLDAGDRFLLVADAQRSVLRIPLDGAGRLGPVEELLHQAGQDAAPSPDGRWLAVTSHDAPAVIYDLATREPRWTLEGTEKLRRVRFSPAGDLLVGSEGNQLQVWDTRDWSAQAYALPEVAPDSSNGAPAFSRDGRYVGIPCGDSSIVVFDLRERTVLHDFFVSDAAALALAFAPDGTQFATAQNNGKINIWSMQDHRRVAFIRTGKSNALDLLFTPDASRLIAGYEDREIVAWQAFDPGAAPAVRRVEPVAGAEADAPEAAASTTTPPASVEVLGETNLLANPAASQGGTDWLARGNAEIETCAAGNPCFVTRYDGEFVGNASLPADAEGRFLLLLGRASAERVHPPGSRDQTGEAYIHGFGEAEAGMAGEHYSADTLTTETHEPGRWSTLWGVFPIGQGIRRVHFEIRQADGHSAKDGSASRFDDLGVFVFDSAEQARGFAERVEHELAARGDGAGPAAKIVSCVIAGRAVFTTEAQCARQGG
jgi:ketosteroid isomerase-like protein